MFLNQFKILYWIYRKVLIPKTDQCVDFSFFTKNYHIEKLHIDFKNKLKGFNIIKINDFIPEGKNPSIITLVAKSKYGKGLITMFSGKKILSACIVKGTPKDFSINKNKTFYQYEFHIPPQHFSNNLYFEFKGQYIIKEIIFYCVSNKSTCGENNNISIWKKLNLYLKKNFTLLPKRTIKVYQKPICDIPWKGRIIISAKGDLYPCCNTFLPIDNLVKKDFFQIWNSKKMQKLRSELLDGRFPDVCRSESCTVYCNSTCDDSIQ